MFDKNPSYRNQKIIRECHNLDNVCQVGLPGCLVSPTVPAHSNKSEDGKGTGIKAHDIFVAISCNHCHDILDGRIKPPQILILDSGQMKHIPMPKFDIEWFHDRAIKRTIKIMLDRGVIK